MIAALFPGQGFEEPGMARDVLDHPYIADASEACGIDVRRALERWTPDLAKTAVLQPVIVAVALASYDGTADVVCGHSIGEIAAFAASGAITARDAIGLAAKRGRAMQRAADARPGGMVSFDDRAIEPHPNLDLAARNTRHLVVQSGEIRYIEEMQARGATRLPVSGAWHGRLMEGIRLEPVRGEPKCTFVTCLDGSVTREPDFEKQITSPVRWDLVMETLARLGVTDFVFPGPQKVMRALVRMNNA